MEEIRRRIAEDLTDALHGALRVDALTTALYATDASLYEIEPLAVVCPRSAEDVCTVATYASENEIPVIPRGAGTGLAGGALGRGIVLDFSVHMNQVLHIGEEKIRVQPGIVHAELNRQLRDYGRYFAPDPSNSAVTTIGGMIGVDAAGSRAVRVGSTRDHVDSIECVLMGGQRLELSRNERQLKRFATRSPNSGPASSRPADGFIPPVANEKLSLRSLSPLTRREDLLERLTGTLEQSADLIRTNQPMLLRNSCGYMLRGVMRGGYLDLPRLLTGSEGTLGLFTEMTLNTMPLPRHRGLGILMFGSMDAALQGMQLLLDLEPSACDLLDRRLLSLGRDADARFAEFLRPDAEAGLFVEFTGMAESEVRSRLSDSEKILQDAGITFVTSRTAFDYDDVELLWSLPTKVVSLLAGLKGESRPLPFVEDIAVPPDRISEFLTVAQRTFQKHEVTATLYAHASSGQLHLRPMLPVPQFGEGQRLEAIARDLYRHVKAVGGTISGEHGDGLSRTAFIRSQYGSLYQTFKQVKEIFDPQRLLNPEKILSDDGRLTVRNLRKTSVSTSAADPSGPTVALPILQLNWSHAEALHAAVRCNGCGACRTTQDSLRMCPFFHELSEEEASPRSKANAVRRSLTQTDSDDLLSDAQIQRLANSCFNCRQCQLECPSEVDIPHLMLEARAQYVATQGLSKTDFLLSRFHTYARFASRFPFMVNRLLRHRVFRGILQKALGIAENRRLPLFMSPFLKSSRVRSEQNHGRPGLSQPTVVYFVDYFANHHDPQLAEAFVRILHHNGFHVYVPPEQVVSGMAMIAVGDLEGAREVAEVNLRELGEPAREGYPILCTEPSAALCLSQEYPLLIDHTDVHIVAEQTQDAGTFLWKLHKEGKLKTDFQHLDLNLAYHTPCHVKALGPETGLYNLLSLIPGVSMQHIEKGCSGMAGTFGIAAEHFAQSLQIGADLVREMKTIDVSAGTTDCSSCRMQMEQQASIPTLHPLKVLALSYGLMPEIAGKLAARPSARVLS